MSRGSCGPGRAHPRPGSPTLWSRGHLGKADASRVTWGLWARDQRHTWGVWAVRSPRTLAQDTPGSQPRGPGAIPAPTSPLPQIQAPSTPGLGAPQASLQPLPEFIPVPHWEHRLPTPGLGLPLPTCLASPSGVMPWPSAAQNPGQGVSRRGGRGGREHPELTRARTLGVTTQSLSPRPPPIALLGSSFTRSGRLPPPPVRPTLTPVRSSLGPPGAGHEEPGQDAKVPVPLATLRAPPVHLAAQTQGPGRRTLK